jgi:hypothetical protein
MDGSVFTDPAKFQGIWFKMHIDAANAVTDPLKEAFVININALCDTFKCKKCQPHFRKFIDTHDFKQYWKIFDPKGADIGFFQWTWELHNQVNKFLGKPQPTLADAYAFYTDTELGACFSCPSSSEPPAQVSRAIPPILTLYRESAGVKPQPFRLIPRKY